MAEKLWIGLVSLLPTEWDDELGGVMGAFTNAVGLATDEQHFVDQIRVAVKEFEMELEEVEDIELFADRIRAHEVSDEIRAMAEEARTEGGIFFSTLHTYDRWRQ